MMERKNGSNYTGNEADSLREDSVYLSYAILFLRNPKRKGNLPKKKTTTKKVDMKAKAPPKEKKKTSCTPTPILPVRRVGI